MDANLINELKNVGKINYQSLQELKNISAALERCAASMERNAVSNERMENLIQQSQVAYAQLLSQSKPNQV